MTTDFLFGGGGLVVVVRQRVKNALKKHEVSASEQPGAENSVSPNGVGAGDRRE